MASLSFGTAAYMEPLFALVLAFAAGLLYKRYSAKSRIVAPAVKATPQFTKDGYPIIEPKGRQAGHWPPDLEFRYPPVEPADFDIETKLPPLYRPFRLGKQFQVMGLRPMDWNEWIQLDKDFLQFMAVRQKRTDEQASDVIFTLPGAEEGAKECVLELASYLPKRYPEIYVVSPPGSEHSAGGIDIQEITCKLRQKTWRLQRSPGGQEACDDSTTVMGLLIQDDTFLMQEQEDGHVRLVGGSACTPGFWRLKDKLGMRLRDLHITSGVPHFEEKLMTPMERFFSRLPVAGPMERNNYFFQLDDVLPWNKKMMGEEKFFVHTLHASDPEAVKAGKVEYTPPVPLVNASDLWLRSERQTLRRMPRTGMILFTVRTYLTNLDTLVKEPRVPGRLLSALNGMDSKIAAYKATELFREAVVPALERAHAEQVASGMIAADDDQQNYPY